MKWECKGAGKEIGKMANNRKKNGSQEWMNELESKKLMRKKELWKNLEGTHEGKSWEVDSMRL